MYQRLPSGPRVIASGVLFVRTSRPYQPHGFSGTSAFAECSATYSPWRVVASPIGTASAVGSGYRRVTLPAVFMRETTFVLPSVK